MKKGNETKQKILDHALQLFSSKGYEETSLKDIATNVNIKPPSIYAYFSSKEELFETIVDFVIDDCIQFVKKQAASISSLPTKDQLYHLLDALNKYYYRNDKGLFLKRYGIFPPEPFKDIVQEKNKRFDHEVQTLLYSIIEREPAQDSFISKEKIAISFICMLDGMLFYLMNLPYEEYEKRLNANWDVFWKGIMK